MSTALRWLGPFAAGLLFGLGLAVSGMMDPKRVLDFLDIVGAWDPSLAFVLGGAVGVSALGYHFAGHLRTPAAAAEFAIPTSQTIDATLIGGAVLFGIGWGLVGLCPGPAIAGLVLGRGPIFVFVAAMAIGMLTHTFVRQPPTGAQTHQPTE